MDECTPIKVICLPMTPFTSGVPHSTHLVASNLPMKTLVARQWPTNTHTLTHNSYVTLIGMHPSITNLFADDPLSPPGYLMVTSTHPVAGN